MAVTINANGLSIVHKGSGGEANATLPDVCLTTVGPAVVPIPYGNNAKSADLVDGTTTVSADGGNSIALKGSKFSKSTGDAGGDKKGVASGTIESEAEFISASPTVKIEGKGVARLSDQMTMNKANTMCLGGVQNPSVSVTPDQEGTYSIDLQCRYPNGKPLSGASYKLKDTMGGVLAEGQLCSEGKATVEGLAPTEFTVEYGEHTDLFSVSTPRGKNLQCEILDDDFFFDIASHTEQPFWMPTGKLTKRHWGYVGASLGDSSEILQMLATEALTTFERQLSVEESLAFAANIMSLLDSENNDHKNTLATLISTTAPLVDDNGEVFSIMSSFHQDEAGDNLLAAIRRLGQGNPVEFVDNINWKGTANAISSKCSAIVDQVGKRMTTIEFQASARQYTWVADNANAHSKKLKSISQKLPEQINTSMMELKSKVLKIKSNCTSIMVVKQFSTGYSTAGVKVSDVVHTLNDLPRPLDIRLTYDDIEHTPASGVPFKVTFANGEEREGVLDSIGAAKLVGVPQLGADIVFGDQALAKQAEDNLQADYDALDKALDDVAIELSTESVTRISPTAVASVTPEAYKHVRELVEAELAELKRQGEAFDDLSYLEKGWEYAKSAGSGAINGVTEYIPDLGAIGELMEEADIGITVLLEALATGDIDILQKKLNGLDRAALGLKEASESMETLLLLISDPTSREYLASLPRRFLEVTPPDQMTQVIVSQVVQKSIDTGMVAGGTTVATAGAAAVGMLGGPATSAAAAGSVGPATATALTGVAVARNGGKALEKLFKVLEEITKKKKAMLNKHDSRQYQKENKTNLARNNGGDCPLCGKQVPKKGKKGKKVKNLCKHDGYKGDLYKDGDSGFGFTRRGTTMGGADKEQRKNSPWKFLGMTPVQHPWWARVYDVNKNGNYTRPTHQDGTPITVAAHHIITIAEMGKNKFLFNLLPQVGYNINKSYNITVLPTIPELACALAVPLHNSDHPNPYTQEISIRLNELKMEIKASTYCKDTSSARAKILKEIKAISENTLSLMNSFSHKGLISQPAEFARDYKKGQAGCRGKINESHKGKVLSTSTCVHRLKGTSHDFRNYEGEKKHFEPTVAKLGG